MPSKKPTTDQQAVAPEMICIPAGEFWMGADRRTQEHAHLFWYDWMQRETPYHRCYLPDYAISRYPITNAHYALFIEADGYQRPEWWTPAGWQQKEKSGWAHPQYWIDRRWNQADHPVVGVCWYECVAYCHWLSDVTGRLYRLPTEAEWEKSARGAAGYLWPWGNRWRSERCNNWEQEIHRTTPVGNYSPGGDSPFGLADAVGNVWEWCATKWGAKYPYDTQTDEWQPEYLAGSAPRTLRGGSWGCIRTLARCAYRERNEPDLRFKDRGYRIVQSLV